MTATDDQIRTAIAEQAADWFVANRAGSLNEAARVAFMSWLRSSPTHIEEYLCIAAIARDLRSAAADSQAPPEPFLAQAPPGGANNVAALDPTVSPRKRLWGPLWTPIVALTAAALASVVVGLVVFSTGDRELPSPSRSYETAHGEHRSWRLADGSSMQLNTDSTVRVRFTRAERLVEVTRGQAFFQVVRDVRRRFRVAVGGTDVVALGTQFDVYTRGKTVVVTVVKGQVAVFSGHAPPPLPGVVPVVGGLTLGTAQQVRIESGVVSAPRAAVDVHQVEAWLHDQIVFDQRPLGEIADEFNRYASIPVAISEPSLRALLVSGVFNAHDTDSFVAFLQTLDGVIVERTSTRIYVLRRSPAGGNRPPKP
jgi:transmembrane sensor